VKEDIIAILHGESGSRKYESFGYVSVSKRLTLFFGDTYTMNLESEPGEGTTVTMVIPALRENEINDYIKGTFV
jgi:two-component system sensor histidine kinase YesM